MDQLIKKYSAAEIPIMAHANGDAAADMLIKAVKKSSISSDHRTVMIHAQTVREDQLDEMKKKLINLKTSILKQFNQVQEQQKFNDWDKDGWNELFDDKSWRGSECAIGSPISLHGSTAGFVLTRIDHFSDITDKDKSVLQAMGKFISHDMFF